MSNVATCRLYVHVLQDLVSRWVGFQILDKHALLFLFSMREEFDVLKALDVCVLVLLVYCNFFAF